MNYKSIEKENKVYFKYLPFKNKNYKNVNKKTNENIKIHQNTLISE